MRTDTLIERLAADSAPRSPYAAARRLTLGVAIGAAIALAAILFWRGQPLAAVGGTGIPAFAMKTAFAVAMAAISGTLLLAAGRPGQRIGWRGLWLAAPPLLVAAMAALELAAMPAALRSAAIFGSTWSQCLASVVLMSIPVLIGSLWALKRLAPTNLPLAGFLAGVTAGATAATLYALYCPETTASFLGIWYSLGILAAGIFGAAIGARVLRW